MGGKYLVSDSQLRQRHINQQRAPDLARSSSLTVHWKGMAECTVKGGEVITIRDDRKYTNDMPNDSVFSSLRSDFSPAVFDAFSNSVSPSNQSGYVQFGVDFQDQFRNIFHLSGNVSQGINYVEAVKQLVETNGGVVITDSSGKYIERIILDTGIVIECIQFYQKGGIPFQLKYMPPDQQNISNEKPKPGGCGGAPPDKIILDPVVVDIFVEHPDADFTFVPDKDDPNSSGGEVKLLALPPIPEIVYQTTSFDAVVIGSNSTFFVRSDKIQSSQDFRYSLSELVSRQQSNTIADEQSSVNPAYLSSFDNWHLQDTTQNHPILSHRKKMLEYKQEESMIMKLLMNPVLRKIWGKMYGLPDEEEAAKTTEQTQQVSARPTLSAGKLLFFGNTTHEKPQKTGTNQAMEKQKPDSRYSANSGVTSRRQTKSGNSKKKDTEGASLSKKEKQHKKQADGKSKSKPKNAATAAKHYQPIAEKLRSYNRRTKTMDKAAAGKKPHIGIAENTNKKTPNKPETSNRKEQKLAEKKQVKQQCTAAREMPKRQQTGRSGCIGRKTLNHYTNISGQKKEKSEPARTSTSGKSKDVIE
jgi:hypothetical protein